MKLTEMSIRKKILSGGTWASMGEFSRILLAFVISILLTRILTPQDLGYFFLVSSFVVLLTAVFSLGLPVTMVKKVSELMAQGKNMHVRKVIFVCAIVMLIMAFLSYFFVVLIGEEVFVFFLKAKDMSPFMSQIGILVSLGLLIALVVEIFRGFHDIRSAVVFGGLLNSFLMLGVLIFLWKIIGAADLQDILYVSIGSLGLVMIIALICMYKKTRDLKKGDERFISIRCILFEIFSISWVMWLIGLLLFVLSNSSLWIISSYGSGEDVALYGIVMRLALFVSVFHGISIAVIKPIISELHIKKDTKKLEKVIRTVASFTFLVALLVTCVFILFSNEILSVLYGEKYAHASEVLVVLSCTNLFSMIVGPVGIVQMMTGLQKYFLTISAVTGVSGVVFSIIIMPEYGILGVAYVWFLVAVLHGLLNVLVIRLKLGIRTYISPRILYDTWIKAVFFAKSFILERRLY